MPKTDLSAEGQHQNVESNPAFRKSGVTYDLLRRSGESLLKSYNALGPDLQKNDMHSAQEISDAVPRKGQ